MNVSPNPVAAAVPPTIPANTPKSNTTNEQIEKATKAVSEGEQKEKAVKALTEADKKNIRIYVGINTANGLQRGMKYIEECTFEERKEITLRILSVSIPTIVGSTAIGAALGAVAGGILGGLKSMGTLSAPGAVVGAKAGAVAGFGVGIVLAPYVTTIAIRNSEHYINWKTRALKEKIYPLFQEFLKETDSFKDLICPLSCDLPVIPVRSPYGHVFEKSWIESWLDMNPSHACPLTRQHFTKSDLVYAQDHVKKIVDRAHAIMREKEKIANPEFVVGLEAFVASAENTSLAVLSAETGKLAEEARDKKLTAEQYGELCKNAFQRSLLAN